MCHVAQELAPSYFDRSCHVSVCGECSCVTTLQGRLIARLHEALGRSLGMTLSRRNLALSDCVRSVRQRKAIPFVA